MRSVSSNSGRKARGTYVHRPVETPSEHRVEVSRLVGRVVAWAIGIGAPAYGEGGLREDGVSRGAESQGSRRRSEREMHRERFVKGHLMLFDGRSQSADMALSEDDRKAERHRKLSNSRIASRSSFQRMREVTMLSNPVLPFFTPSYDGLDKRLHYVRGNRAVLSIRHTSRRFSEHRPLFLLYFGLRVRVRPCGASRNRSSFPTPLSPRCAVVATFGRRFFPFTRETAAA
jgi:hypothetical protein